MYFWSKLKKLLNNQSAIYCYYFQNRVTRGTLELIDSQDGGGGQFLDNPYDSKDTSVECK